MSKFKKLPQDILYNIFSRLDNRNLMRIAATCHSLQSKVQHFKMNQLSQIAQEKGTFRFTYREAVGIWENMIMRARWPGWTDVIRLERLLQSFECSRCHALSFTEDVLEQCNKCGQFVCRKMCGSFCEDVHRFRQHCQKFCCHDCANTWGKCISCNTRVYCGRQCQRCIKGIRVVRKRVRYQDPWKKPPSSPLWASSWLTFGNVRQVWYGNDNRSRKFDNKSGALEERHSGIDVDEHVHDSRQRYHRSPSPFDLTEETTEEDNQDYDDVIYHDNQIDHDSYFG